MGNDLVQGGQREHLAFSHGNQTAHILPTHTESPTVYAGDHLIVRLTVRAALIAHPGKALNARHFVPRRAVIAGYLGLNEDRGVELIGNEEVRCLVVARDALGPFRFSESNASTCKMLLDSSFHHIAHLLRHRVSMCGERPTKVPFVQQHSVGHLHGGHAGAPTSVHVVDPQGNRDTRNSKGPAFPLPENYSIAYDVAGSGGYGNPQNRNPNSIPEDIINGYVSPDQAQQEYGVDASGMVCEHCGGRVK